MPYEPIHTAIVGMTMNHSYFIWISHIINDMPKQAHNDIQLIVGLGCQIIPENVTKILQPIASNCTAAPILVTNCRHPIVVVPIAALDQAYH